MSLFAREKLDNKDFQEAIRKMDDQIKAAGGRFTFDFKVDNDGWFARCREFDGIVTGGLSKNPSEKEVMQSMIDAIKTAFDIPINKLEIESEEPEKLPKIEIVREFAFA